MFVINENSATRRLYNDEIMDEPVEFAETTGTAQVDQELGKALVSEYDSIRRKDDED
ncbi:hypothetical protein [Halostella sp. PRR32]|uniref:hypothetical protein n=1 Tax=Halostella sp. PRR32 TaxID=3098147 RepID=UPI002B1DB6B3|nr:hypothetical protein [Halostella sp. PRR32]